MTSFGQRLRADGALLVTAVIWGTAFIAQKDANTHIGPIIFVGLRFLLSAIIILPLLWFEAKQQTQPLKKRDILLGCLVGLCLFCGASLQQTGLLTTTATNAGFLTSLYVVLVPFVGWILTRKPPRIVVLFACALSLSGAWLLAFKGNAAGAHVGDFLVIIANIAWAIAITLVPVFLARTHRPFMLSFLQYIVTAVLGLSAGMVLQMPSSAHVQAALPAILYAGLVSGGIAYTLQIIAQKYVPSAEAALIMSLESVFAAIAGAIAFGERLTVPAACGCGLILLAIVIVEATALLKRVADQRNGPETLMEF